MSRHTQPKSELQILLEQLRLSFPNQPSPRVATIPMRQSKMW